MAHSPHRRWKGCQLCKGYKFRDDGQAARQRWSSLRQIGKRRRLRRHEPQID